MKRVSTTVMRLVRIVDLGDPDAGVSWERSSGITQALGDLDPNCSRPTSRQAMEGLMAGLYVAFDTTSLALSLSMVLMFVQFLAERMETQLLSIVDTRASEELMGRFETTGTARDPQVATIQRMAREVIQANEKLVARQSEIWKASIDAANEHWSQSARESAEQIRERSGGDAWMQSSAAASPSVWRRPKPPLRTRRASGGSSGRPRCRTTPA